MIKKMFITYNKKNPCPCYLIDKYDEYKANYKLIHYKDDLYDLYDIFKIFIN